MRDENEISACGEAGEWQPWRGLGEASVIGDGKISGQMMLAGPVRQLVNWGDGV